MDEVRELPGRYGQPLKPSAVNRYRDYLSVLFGRAVRWGWLDQNPVSAIQRHREKPRTRFLGMEGYPEDEMQRLLDACAEDRLIYAFVVLSLQTAARASELLGLRWSDVNLKDGRALLHDTKNGKPRFLPLNAKARDILQELRGDGRIGMVFEENGRIIRYHDRFRKACERAGITDLVPHDLRRTAASLLVQNGVSIAEVAELLGHSNIAITHRAYAHLTTQTIVRMGDRLAELTV
jgi:integrase